MAKMKRAQAKRRLTEASTKIRKVFFEPIGGEAMSIQDFVALEKLLNKCIKRLDK